jgi:hypothetical protein
MALLGPVGSGKTALVYAAAQELGFGVLEVNPSMERTAGQVGRLAVLWLVWDIPFWPPQLHFDWAGGC